MVEDANRRKTGKKKKKKMVDWVCGSLGGSLIPRLHLTTLLRRLRLQTNLYYADSAKCLL